MIFVEYLYTCKGNVTDSNVWSWIQVDDKKKLNKIGRWYKPWFYKHVQSFIQKWVESSVILMRS